MLTLRKIGRCLLDLTFPDLCAACGYSLNEGESVLCNKCIYDIPRTNYHLQNDNPLARRFWGRAEVENVTALFFYQKGSTYRHLIHLLKYDNRQDIGEALGRIAAADLLEAEEYSHFDYIIPVPLHPNKQRRRGYNQSESICRGLSEIMHVPMNTNNLVRTIENPTQTKKSVWERWENTVGIFSLNDPAPFEGKHILLVDDVLTTGSTMIACTEALRKANNLKITLFALAAT